MTTVAHRLVLIRHGQSTWNQENRFTGWTDVDLTERGVEEARTAGQSLREAGLGFDVAYTSLLTRAIRTCWHVLEELDLRWIPVHRTWRLNERHYGGLQGLNKSEMAAQHGEEQVHIWRRSYATPPPELSTDDERHPRFDPKYQQLDPRLLPGTEALLHTVERVLPFWMDEIAPTIRSGRRVLIAAHGNSLRALVKYLDEVSEDAITGLNIPTGMPLLYELDADLRPLSRRYLGDPEAVAKAQAEVEAQGKANG